MAQTLFLKHNFPRAATLSSALPGSQPRGAGLKNEARLEFQVTGRGAYRYRRDTGARMQPRDLVQAWVDAFNRADVDALARMYSEHATNQQVAEEPVVGRIAIREMFAKEFVRASMVCIVENLFQDGDWAILEWRDPLGLRGCVCFHVVNDEIVVQRGYWDKLSFLRTHKLPIPGA